MFQCSWLLFIKSSFWLIKILVVVWKKNIFPYIYIYIGNNNPIWRLFFRGVGQPPTSYTLQWLSISHWKSPKGRMIHLHETSPMWFARGLPGREFELEPTCPADFAGGLCGLPGQQREWCRARVAPGRRFVFFRWEVLQFCDGADKYVGVSENVGYMPNEIAIFHRDNDQQNHWV